MRIGIVGGTGNISTSIVRLLLQQGHEVTCCNRGRSGPVPEGARAVHGDRSDREAFERAMQGQAFEAAVDMICFSAEDAASSLRAFQGVKHLVYCSTVDTYGTQRDWLPVTEDHPLRPITPYARGKVEADSVFLTAFHRDGSPVTIIKPATTYGPKSGALRQIAWDFSWIDRVRKGKPVVVCGDGNAIHQFLHVDDAALCFANVLGKEHCIGQTYNMVNRGFTTWAEYHRTAMKVLGREVELVGVPLADLRALAIPNGDILWNDFAHHMYFSAEKLFRDVPEFRPVVSLEEGLRQVIGAMDEEGRVPDSDEVDWEDRLIAAQRAVRRTKLA